MAWWHSYLNLSGSLKCRTSLHGQQFLPNSYRSTEKFLIFYREIFFIKPFTDGRPSPISPIHYRVCRARHTSNCMLNSRQCRRQSLRDTNQWPADRIRVSCAKPWNLQTWQQSNPIPISWRQQAQCCDGTNPLLIPFPLHVWRDASPLLKSQPFLTSGKVCTSWYLGQHKTVGKRRYTHFDEHGTVTMGRYQNSGTL